MLSKNRNQVTCLNACLENSPGLVKSPPEKLPEKPEQLHRSPGEAPAAQQSAGEAPTAGDVIQWTSKERKKLNAREWQGCTQSACE